MKIQIFPRGLVAVLAGVTYVGVLRDQNEELTKEKLILETQVETFEANIELLEAQLDTEREIRDNADVAIQELQQEVPDVDYNTPLPDSIQGVLDNFHSSTR